MEKNDPGWSNTVAWGNNTDRIQRASRLRTLQRTTQFNTRQMLMMIMMMIVLSVVACAREWVDGAYRGKIVSGALLR